MVGDLQSTAPDPREPRLEKACLVGAGGTEPRCELSPQSPAPQGYLLQKKTTQNEWSRERCPYTESDRIPPPRTKAYTPAALDPPPLVEQTGAEQDLPVLRQTGTAELPTEVRDHPREPEHA